MIRTLLLILLLTVSVSPLWAQSECELTLGKAQEEFDAGRFNAVPAILRECLEKNQGRDWEQRAYLLLSETYLLLEDPDKADASYLKVLQANPEFTTDQARDPIDVVYLSKKFTASPIFSLYGNLGLNATFVRVINDVSTAEGDSEQKYTPGIAWQLGGGVEYAYSERLSLAAEFNFSFTRYSHRAEGLFPPANDNQDFTSRQTWMRLPVMVRYTLPGKSFRPYTYLGYSPNLMLEDRGQIVSNSNIESPTYDFRKIRNTLNHSVIVGAGVKYKWKLRYFFADVRYSFGLSNIASVVDRHKGEFIYEFTYIDDDFRTDNIFFNVGYVHPFYKARALKKAKTKSVLRGLKRRDNENR